MAYSTLADLTLELGAKKLAEITSEVVGGTEIDEAKVTKAIRDADAEIDLFLNKRYTVPFSPVPDIVAAWSLAIAAYNVFPKPSEKMPPIRKINRDRAKAQVKAVAENEMDIPGITVPGNFHFGRVPSTHFDDATEFGATKDVLEQG